VPCGRRIIAAARARLRGNFTLNFPKGDRYNAVGLAEICGSLFLALAHGLHSARLADHAPCSEGVRWIVMTTPIQLSAGQIERFAALIHDNNRPTQPLNGRPVLAEAVSMAPR
jgi:Eukaryotic-type carbonic anhydrase